MQLQRKPPCCTSQSSYYTEIAEELNRYDVEQGTNFSIDYLAHFDNAQQSVFIRLLSALIREEILDTELAKAHGLIIETTTVTSTGRLAIVAPVRWCDGTEVTDPVLLLRILIGIGIARADSWQRLILEISSSVSGQALALCAADQRAAKLCAHLGAHQVNREKQITEFQTIVQGNPFTILLNTLRDEGNQGSLLSAFEQLVFDGHPLHPCAKTKIGMSATDSIHFAPEFGVSIDLRFVAVARHSAIVSVDDDEVALNAFDHVSSLLHEAFPCTMAAAEAELISAGRHPSAHLIIPVHPHQLQVALPQLHAPSLANGTIFPLSTLIRAKPMLSVRTLEVKESSLSIGLSVKTALEVQMTSAIRGVSRESAHNSPKLSELFRAITKQDLDLQHTAKNDGPTFVLCRDLAGIAYLPHSAPKGSADEINLVARNRSLNAILRQNPDGILGQGEIAMPIASISVRSPITRRTIMADLLTELCTKAARDATLTSIAEDWLRQHVELCVPPALTLLTRYGIALEPHAQNTVVVLKDGRPHRILVRDLGGAGVLREQLDRRGFSVDLMAGTGLWEKSAESLRNKLFFPLFGNHLGELVATIADAANCNEAPFWAVIRECVSRTFLHLRSSASSEAEAKGVVEHARALLHNPWRLKTLLSMRIAGLVTDYEYIDAPNPLALHPSSILNAQELKAAHLNQVEQQMFAELFAHDPNLARRWLLELPAARETTVTDVRASLLRENVPGSALLDKIAASRPEELLDELVAEGQTALKWTQLREELVDSACNLALSRASVRRRGEQLRQRAAGLATNDIIRTLAATGMPSDVTLDIDGLCAEGHNLHPCKRTRTGFAPMDSLVYTAESNGYVGVQFLAVRRDLTFSTPESSGRSVGEIIGEHYPGVVSQANGAIRRRGFNPAEYELIPMHPWQAKHALPAEYSEELATCAMVLLPEVQLRCRPTVSVRSLVTAAPGKFGKRLMLKTPIDILLTSAQRTISVASTRDGPLLSSLIYKIVTEELDLAEKVDCARDLAGIAFAPPPWEEHTSSPRQRGLSVILREDPSDRLLPGEHIISGCAFSAMSPLSDVPLLAELINNSAEQGDMSFAESAKHFLETYTNLLCSVGLPMLWRYGIGLELHLQNVLLVIRDHQPVRLVLRDFNGLQMHLGQMREANLDFEPHSNSVSVAKSFDEVRAKFSHSLILANLAEVVRILATVFGLKPDELFSVVRGVMHRIRDKADPAWQAQAHREVAHLLSPTLQGKALVTMRLVNAKYEMYGPQSNPLHL